MIKAIFVVEAGETSVKLMHMRRGVVTRKLEECPKITAMKDILLNFIALNRIKTKNVRLILNSRETVLKCVTMNVPYAEVSNALKYDLKSYIFIDTNEYIVDYKITKAAKNKTHILIAAAPRNMILEYISIFNKIKISLTHVDVYQNCVARAFNSESNTLVVLECGEKVQLLFLDKGILNGFREIPMIEPNSVINEISKLFDSFLTSLVFESVFILSKRLSFLAEYFDSLDINCRMPEETDFLALENSMF